MRKKALTLFAVILILSVFMCACSKPSFELSWNIQNCSGYVGDLNDARQTFTVFGELTLDNYGDCDSVLLTVEAVDQMGYTTNLSCVLSINGDGVYPFSIQSVYKTSGGWVASIKNATVKKL